VRPFPGGGAGDVNSGREFLDRIVDHFWTAVGDATR